MATKKVKTTEPINENENFVLLCPGNWFDLRTFNKEQSQPFDLFSLQKEIYDQVNARDKNLEFIKESYPNGYGKSELSDIEFRLNDSTINKFSKMMKTERMHPIITFHGTPRKENVESIFNTGYIIPGTTVNGVTSKTNAGAVFGTGIYSSPHFNKAQSYTAPDNSKMIYVLINLLFLGKMKLIPPSKLGVDFSAPQNGVYADGTNTRIVYGLDQIISADTSRIIPVGVMKIKIG